MAYVPVKFYKGSRIEIADTPSEYWQLIWEGWSAQGPAPEYPAFTPRQQDELSATFAPVSRAPLCVLFGDSRTADCTYDDATNVISTNNDWFTWGQAANAAGPVFEVVNKGIGGNTTTQMLARIQTDVLDLKPSHMTLWGGINDSWASYAEVDATYARMVEMMELAHAAGVYVFLISETTASTGVKPAPYQLQVQYFNDLLRAYAASHPGVEFWDFNAQIVDPLSTVGQPLTGLLRDGLHLGPKGASKLGKNVVAPRLARFGTRLTQLPSSIIDSRFYGPSAANVLTNPLMTGTGGSKSAGHTGSLPDGWNSSGTPTATCAVTARADGYGNDMVLTITAASASSFSVVNTISSSRFTPGATYVIEAALSIESNDDLYSVSLLGQFFNGATTYSYGHGNTVQGFAAGQNLEPMSGLVLRSRPFVAPPAFTSTSLALTARFADAGSAVVRLGRVAYKRIA